jgi:hypothetical protein
VLSPRIARSDRPLRARVVSSAIRSVDYDAESETLSSGSQRQTYAYLDVPAAVYEAFLAAESKGGFFATRYRGAYDSIAHDEIRRARVEQRDPRSAKSAVLRVTSVMPFASVIEAISRSNAVGCDPRCEFQTRVTRAALSSNGSTRPPNRPDRTAFQALRRSAPSVPEQGVSTRQTAAPRHGRGV